jgi:hypothetical protein
MATEPDDDALRWAGDTDPTLDAPVAGAAARPREDPELPDGWSVPKPRRDRADPVAVTAPAAGSFALVGMGVVAGIYFLYTVGWFLSASRVGNPLADPVGAFMFSLGAWLAGAAPLIWFGAVVWLTDERPRARAGWLIAGVVLLVPVPVILGVGGVS